MAILYYCSDGSRVSEATIKARYSKALKAKHEYQHSIICEACNKERAQDNSHIIAKARLKVLHKTELIWHPLAFFSACRECHRKWENWKSGEYLDFVNIVALMLFVKEHDPENYRMRMNFEYKN